MKNIKKILTISLFSLLLINFTPARATVSVNDVLPLNTPALEKMGAQEKAFNAQAGFNSAATVGGIVATIIRAVLGLLAIIFLVLIVYAGYLWMMARGNEDDVKKAKDIIISATIGLIIVIAAYSITSFVFNALNNASSGGGGNGPV